MATGSTAGARTSSTSSSAYSRTTTAPENASDSKTNSNSKSGTGSIVAILRGTAAANWPPVDYAGDGISTTSQDAAYAANG
jgi:hypothetical protein